MAQSADSSPVVRSNNSQLSADRTPQSARRASEATTALKAHTAGRAYLRRPCATGVPQATLAGARTEADPAGLWYRPRIPTGKGGSPCLM